ncbi:DUF5986 family protein [Neobacillus drentensis]|uniref:DUF5986 family protein n=1 Tax=Neobacillus drentensis TaxID=220684 RepID=UPI002FFEA1AA
MIQSLIPATKDLKDKIVQGIYNGNTYDYQDFKGKKKTTINNGTPFNRMDYIYEGLINNFKGDDSCLLKAVTSPRTWQKHLQIYHKESKILYLVVKDDRIHGVKMLSGTDRSPHYLEAYSVINKKLSPSNKLFFDDEQLSANLFPDSVAEPEFMGEFYHKKRNSLFSMIGSLEVEMVVFISITIKKDELIDVKAHVPSEDFLKSFLYNESWSNHIPVSFNTAETPSDDEDTDDGIQMGIKKKYLEEGSVNPSIKRKAKIVGSIE